MSGQAVTVETHRDAPGVFGKLPGFGDFFRRRLPKSFVEPMDAWLQAGMEGSRKQLAEKWLQGYLTSPFWRFALSPGLCGESVATGVIMPSVDAVGRHYPLVIAIVLPTCGNPLSLPFQAEEWYAAAEDVALSTLGEDFRVGDFEARVDELGSPNSTVVHQETAVKALVPISAGNLGWTGGQEKVGDAITAIYPVALDRMARSKFALYSVWWTSGSDRIPSAFLLYQGLPPTEDFAALLCGPLEVEKTETLVWS